MRQPSNQTEKLNRMGKILFYGIYGSDDPTRTSLPQLGASGALAHNHESLIIFTGEAVHLMGDEVTNSLHEVWVPSAERAHGADGATLRANLRWGRLHSGAWYNPSKPAREERPVCHPC